MADTVSYRPKAGEIPTQPGVYRFRDEASRVLYVGKAKNLRARLSNYFAPLSSLHERTRRMVLSANSVEWTVVGTEFEAWQSALERARSKSSSLAHQEVAGIQKRR